ncbi:MAG: hypothetical protein WAR21_14330 [Candidatus Acidiferrales bacterium]
MSAKERRKQVGCAVWLAILLGGCTPNDWDGSKPTVVSDGNVISDEELARLLETTASVVANWRCRLRRAGVLRWLVDPGKGRIFILEKIDGLAATPQAVPVKTEMRTEEAQLGQAPEFLVTSKAIH